MFVTSRLKATKIIGQRKAFYMQRIPESSCTKKETGDIDVLVTSSLVLEKVIVHCSVYQWQLKNERNV